MENIEDKNVHTIEENTIVHLLRSGVSAVFPMQVLRLVFLLKDMATYGMCRHCKPRQQPYVQQGGERGPCIDGIGNMETDKEEGRWNGCHEKGTLQYTSGLCSKQQRFWV